MLVCPKLRPPRSHRPSQPSDSITTADCKRDGRNRGVSNCTITTAQVLTALCTTAHHRSPPLTTAHHRSPPALPTATATALTAITSHHRRTGTRMFAPEERAQWRQCGHKWSRLMGAGCTVRLEVRPSPIEGMGLFWDDACDGEDGQHLGRFSGRVVFASDSQDAAKDWALKQVDDRLIMLRLDGQWAIVDTRGSVFEFANHAEEGDAVLHVTEAGFVELKANVKQSTELTWYYGRLHAASHIHQVG